MYTTYRPLPPQAADLSLFPPKQTKVMMQRQYREKEGECFSALREVIKGFTGTEAEIHTRQEILRKAINLLSVIVETRRQQNEAHSVSLIQTETYNVAAAYDPNFGYLTQSFHEPHFNAGLTAPSVWYPDLSASAMESLSGECFHEEYGDNLEYHYFKA